MRHAFLSYGLPLVVVAACSSSSSPETHGPVYGDDDAGDASSGDAGGDAQGADAARDTGADASADASNDASSDSAADASGDATSDATGDANGCTSTAAVVAGSSSILAVATAVGGTWGAASTLVGSAGAAPAVSAYGGGFAAVVESSNGALVSTTYTSIWTTPAAIGAASARDRPATAAIGTSLHLVYQDPSSYDFFHAVLSAGTWSPTAEAVGSPQSFGPSGPAVAAVGADLVVAQSGSNGFVYDQTWSGSWQAANEHTDAAALSGIAPSIVALSGGSADLLIVYVRSTNSDYHLMFTTRTAGVWSTAAEVYDENGNIAYTSDEVSLAALSGGRAVLVFRGGNMVPYFSIFDGTSTWTAPAAVVTSTTTVSTVPSVATGVCGDDAIAALVETNGDVDVTSLRAGAWSATPTHVTSAMAYAGIATRP